VCWIGKICEDAAGGTRVKPCLRKVLADSHIAAVAIVVLLAWSLEWMFDAVWTPFFRVSDWVINAIAILGIPSGSGVFGSVNRSTLFVSLVFLCSAATAVAAASILSRWVYGGTTMNTLREYHARIARRFNV
jgi:hypothetical protein